MKRVFHPDDWNDPLKDAAATALAPVMVKAALAEYGKWTKQRKAASLKYDPSQPRDESGRWGSGGSMAADGGRGSGGIAEATPTERTKSEIAKANAKRVDKDIQRYSEEHNEPMLAKALGGESLDDNEPVDVVTTIDGKLHGIELKTMVDNDNNKLTMKADAMQRKASWARRNGGKVHTVVYDDHKVFNAKGAGKHDYSKREIYYRRGYGSFRVNGMHKVESMAELKSLMTMNARSLPKGAK